MRGSSEWSPRFEAQLGRTHLSSISPKAEAEDAQRALSRSTGSACAEPGGRGGPRRLEGRAGPARATPARTPSRCPAESHQRRGVGSCCGRLPTWLRDSGGHTASGFAGPSPVDDVTAPPPRARGAASSRVRVPALARARAETRPGSRDGPRRPPDPERTPGHCASLCGHPDWAPGRIQNTEAPSTGLRWGRSGAGDGGPAGSAAPGPASPAAAHSQRGRGRSQEGGSRPLPGTQGARGAP